MKIIKKKKLKLNLTNGATEKNINQTGLELLSSSVLLVLLFACGGQEADHLHRQLQTLKVMFEILSFHREAVLLVSGGHGREDGET